MNKRYELKFVFGSRHGVVLMDVSQPCNQWLVELAEDVHKGRQRDDVVWLD